MQYKFREYLLVGVLFVCLVTAANAMHYEGAGVAIDLVPGAGNSTDLSNDDVHIQDIKGYPFTGPFTDGDVIIETGLGVLVGTGEGEIIEPPTSEIADTGRIRETNIIREGNDLRINWGYNELGPIAVKIYVLSGVDVEFQNDAAAFSTELASLSESVSTYLHIGAAYDGNSNYYRVVPDPLVNPDIMADENNSIGVGKTETSLPANKFVFSALPFMEDSISLAGILGEQIGTDGDFLWWNGAGYQGATYAGSWVGDDRSLRLAEAFIVRAKAEKQLALVGRFGTLITPYNKDLTNNQYELIGYPYPTQKQIEAMGITPVEDSDLLKWVVESQVYDGATYNGSAWVGVAGVDLLQLGRPRFYRPKADFTWEIQAP